MEPRELSMGEMAHMLYKLSQQENLDPCEGRELFAHILFMEDVLSKKKEFLKWVAKGDHGDCHFCGSNLELEGHNCVGFEKLQEVLNV